MRNLGRKALKVMLAVAIGLGGLLTQTGGTSLVAAEQLESVVDEASENMMRSLLAELEPESLAELQDEPTEADGGDDNGEVESIPPESVESADWRPAYPPDSAVLLEWEPPRVSDGEGGWIPDPSVTGYRIYNKAGDLLKETTDTETLIEQLAPATRYELYIRAVNAEGQLSSSYVVYAGTSPAGEIKLGEAEFTAGPLLSRDGSAVLYMAGGEPLLHRIDTANGADQILQLTTTDGQAPNGDIQELATDRTGATIAFASNATNLDAAADGSKYAVYVYRADTGALTPVSDLSRNAQQPSLSASGDRIVFAEDRQIYMYDLNTMEKTLISHAEDGAPGNGSSRNPLLSGDGTRIVYATTSDNLKGEPAPDWSQYVAVYDCAADTHIWISGYSKTPLGLSVSEDGKYVVFTTGGGIGWRWVHAVDLRSGNRAEWSDDRFPDNRDSYARKDKNYETTSMNGDGRFVLAQLHDNNPQGGLYVTSYAERFDRETGQVDRVGNPALNMGEAQIDENGNRVLYIREGTEMYTYCYTDCQQSHSGDGISAAYWSAAEGDMTRGSVHPGSAIVLKADGKPGQTVVADIAYLEMTGDDPEPTQSGMQTVALEETPASSGQYRATFGIAQGMTQIEAITVRLQDHSSAKAAANLPINVAGRLAIDVTTAYPEILRSASFEWSGAMSGSVTRKPLTAGVTHYEYWWSADTDLNLVLKAADGTELARQDGIVVNKGAATTVNLTTEEIASTLTVRLSYKDQPVVAEVTFKDTAGAVIAQTQTNEQGVALLEQRQAGERIRVAVAPPAGYRLPAEQLVTLAIGGSELSIPLQQLNEIYTVDYDRTVGSGSDKVPTIGSEVYLHVQSASGHTLRAKLRKTVWDADGAPVTAEQWVEMTESSYISGNYSGVFTIEEGTAALKDFALETDGSLQPDLYSIERRIASRLNIVIDAPANVDGATWLENGTLGVTGTDASNGYYRFYQAVNGQERIVAVDVPVPGKPYQINFNSRTSLSSYAYATSPESGQTAEAVLTPLFGFEYTLNVKAESGDNARFQAVFRHADSREIVWSGYVNTGTIARITLPRKQAAAERLELIITPSDPTYESTTVSFDADARSRRLDVTLLKKAEAHIHGRVIGTDGKPATGSMVTAVIGRDWATKSYTAQTDANGEYSLHLPAGETVLRAKRTLSRAESLSQVVTVQAAGDMPFDLQLNELATVELRLFTRFDGGVWNGPLALDDSTRYHMRTMPDFSYKAFVNGAYQAWATIGDSVRICVDGVESGLPQACGEAVIGQNNRTDIELRLENAGGQASFRAFAPNGEMLQRVIATVYDLDNGTVNTESVMFDRIKQQLTVQLSSAGNKRLKLLSLSGNAEASINFTARQGGIVALGDIHLQSAGYFSGNGNGLAAGADWTTPGGHITVRATYKNNGYKGMEMASDAVLALEWPAGVEFAPGTLVLNGKAVTPNVSGRMLEVPVGDVAWYSSGSLQLQLQVKGNAVSSPITLAGTMKYKTDAGLQEQLLGTALLNVSAVTIRAPKLVDRTQFEVNGYAPAGATVTVFDGGVEIGRTLASPTGTWEMTVVLNGSKAGKHRLTTEASLVGVRSPGESVTVTYDPDDPGLSSVKMLQPAGGMVEFDPARGVAVFPFVVYPSKPFVFELKFRDASRISDVYVQIGGNGVKAQRTEDGFQAIVPFSYDFGPVSVDYNKKPLPDDGPGTIPTEEEFRSDLPQDIAGYELEWKAGPGEQTPEGSVMNARSAAVKVKLNRNMTAKLSVKAEASNYTPSAGERQKAEESGIPVYGFSMRKSGSDTSRSIRISGYVPENASSLAAESSGRRSIAALGGKETFVLKAIEIAIDITGNGLTVRDLVQGTFDAIDQDRFEIRINAAIEEIEQICDEKAREYYSNMAWEIKADIFMHNMVKTGLGIASVVAVPGGLFGIAFWGESYYIGLKLDEVANNELTELETHLRLYRNELCERKKPPKPPIAAPVFIWDPSGYVYEGRPDNRLKGVTATVLEKNAATDEWNVWDAEWYGQQNPLVTDAQGQYGWDVPKGKWMVKYEKEGYVTEYSEELDVPPPQLEVNIPLRSYDAPTIRRVKAAPGGAYVDVYFSKPIDTASVLPDAIAVTSASGGDAAAGTAQAVDPVEENGKLLANVIRFTPTAPLADGDYNVVVAEAPISYAGVAAETEAELRIRVTGTDTEPPAEAESVQVGVTGDQATIVWLDPDDDDYAKARIRWKRAGDAAYGAPMEVAKGEGWAQIAGLSEASSYEFKVSTVDEAGNESNGAAASWSADTDRHAPLTAFDLQAATTTDSTIVLRWTDPVSADLAKLRLTWAETAHPETSREGEAQPGAGTFTISGLKPATTYTISLMAIDHSGNESSGFTIEVATKASSGSGGSGGTGGGAGGPAGGPIKTDDKPENSQSAEVKVGREGGSFDLFDGWIKLTVQPETYSAASVLKLDREGRKGNPSSTGYTQLSDSVRIAGDGDGPGRPLQLSIQLDPAAIGQTDARRLGIYKRDSASPTGWTYIGGVYEKGSLRIKAAISAYGEYAVLLYEHEFADLTAHWSCDEVGVLVSRHLVNGVSAERFEPNRAITRAEVTRLLVGALRQNGFDAQAPSGTQPSVKFADVSGGAWYAADVEAAVKLGLVYGANGRFRPNDPVTREELAVLLQRLAGLTDFVPAGSSSGEAQLDRFKDKKDVSAWAQAAVELAVRQGWLQGMATGELQPSGQATRAQAASLLLRVLVTIGAIEKE